MKQFIVAAVLTLVCSCVDRQQTNPDGVEYVDTEIATDADADGWDERDDCNDSDASVHPCAADPRFDGVDQDCGGTENHDADTDRCGAVDDEGEECCVTCDDGKPCGDTCIARDAECHVGDGCAC